MNYAVETNDLDSLVGGQTGASAVQENVKRSLSMKQLNRKNLITPMCKSCGWMKEVFSCVF